MGILFDDDKNRVDLRRKEEFNVPLDVLAYGSLIVASATILLSIMGGMFP